jgi:hypothetical protein
LKDSLDLSITGLDDWRDVVSALHRMLVGALGRYLRVYPHCVLSPLKVEAVAPGGTSRLDPEALCGFSDQQMTAFITRMLRVGAVNLQKYVANRGGYPYWHSEIFPAADYQALHRVLLWTLYLNQEFTEGETEFLYQSRKISPRTGALLLAPAGFTHTHRGNTPRGGNKYIATGWVLYPDARELYARTASRPCS